ncbi:MAG: heme-binding beta-barrel domain-containing protein, partial [Mariprofundaceae bacterium]
MNEPDMAASDILGNLGPLAPLAGVWEGDQGVDIAPGRDGPAKTQFRERITFEPMGPVENGPQTLYGLRYATVAWPMGEDEPFHEELGYWMWDADAKTVMRCFMVPRVVTVNAIGKAETHAKSFVLSADLGS